MLNSTAYYFKKSILYIYVSDSELPVAIIKKIFFFFFARLTVNYK